MTYENRIKLLKDSWKKVNKIKLPNLYLDEVYKDMNRGIQRVRLSVNEIS